MLNNLARRLRDDVSNTTRDAVTWNRKVQGLKSSGKDIQAVNVRTDSNSMATSVSVTVSE
jgi:hypothetical protein